MVIANASNVDFMIKGVTKFHAFGQDLWITTTEIGLSIITIVILILAFATDRKMKRATEVPGTFQNIMELLVESLDKMVKETMGHNEICQLYRNDLSLHFILQYQRIVRA
jgi:F-type H+-transporting ATPase subunit a